MEIREERPGLLVDLYEDFRPHFEKRITRWATDKMADGDVTVLVVAWDAACTLCGGNRCQPTPVGLACAVVSPDSDGERGVVVVKASHRNRGIGTALVAARTAIRPGVISRVWDGNTPSVRVCEKAKLPRLGEELGEKRILIFGGRGG